MRTTILMCFCFWLLCIANNQVFGQQPLVVTDSMPATQDGLSMGYTIKSVEVKEVSDKGNFSRYSIKFYVTNISNEAKIILYKDGWNVLGNVSDRLVQFNCLNATGARFTSKSATLSAAPCEVMAIVEDKNADGKIVKNKRFVQIGYWIKAGQTFSTSAILIVPLNEKPRMEAIYLANSLQPTASAVYSTNATLGETQNSTPLFDPKSFFRIKSISKNTFLNNQYGPLACSNIDDGWWSAQWQFLPVQGTNYYFIKNRWKENYISTGVGSKMLSPNEQMQTAMWTLEPVANTNQYRIRSVGDGTYLNVLSGDIQSTILTGESQSAKWVIEP